jgi:hypothetical protein
MDAYVINLDKRPDRWQQFQEAEEQVAALIKEHGEILLHPVKWIL